MADRFTRAELGLVGSAAALVFTRVLAFSLTTLGFTEHARGLSGIPPGQSDLLAGLALGAYGLTMALAQLGTGMLSDRIGRRRVLVGGTVAFVLGAALCAVADSIWLLLAGRLLAGLGGVSSVALAAVGETVDPTRRTRAMALVGVPAGAAVFLGFVAGPPLAAAAGFASLFWLSGLLGLAASAGFLARALPPARPGLAAPARSLTLPVLALAGAGFTANFAMTAVMFDVQSTVLPQVGTTGFGLMLVAAFAAMALATRRVDRTGRAWLPVVAATALLALSAPVFRLGTQPLLVAAAGVLFFACHATLSAVLPAQVSRHAGRSGGRGHGVQLVVAYLGGAAGGVVAGATAGAALFAETFVALAAAAGLACALGLAAARAARAPVPAAVGEAVP
jgi:MFS family permease